MMIFCALRAKGRGRGSLLFICALLAVFACLGQAQNPGAIVRGLPPGGVGAACLTGYIGYLVPVTGGERIILCDPVAHLWTAQGAGTVTSVSGTTNEIDVATGTTTPVISVAAAILNDTIAACSDVGSSENLYACSTPVAIPYVTNGRYRFRANTDNTAAASINFNAQGGKTIVKVAGGITTALAANDIRAGQVVDLVYDGTNMQMQSTLGNVQGASPAGSAGAVETYATSSTFGGDNSKFQVDFVGLATPAAPSLATAGTAGATTYGYELVRKNLIGGSIASAETTIATGNATLSAMNKIVITAPACLTTQLYWDVWRTTAGGTPATTGLIIENVACGGTLQDTGLATIPPFDSVTAPSVSTSLGIGATIPYVNTSPGSCFGTDCQANNDATFYYADSGTGLSVLGRTSAPGFDYNNFYSSLIVDSTTGGSFYAAVIDTQVWANSGRVVGMGVDIFGQSGSSKTVTDLAGLYTQIGGDSRLIVTNDAVGIGADVHIISATNSYTFWAGGPAGTVSGITAAYFNVNFGAGNFSWYNEGGTLHSETGAATNVGMDIERFSMQSADLLQFVDSDGMTVLAQFTSDARLTNRSVAFAALGTPANGTQVYCSDCTNTSNLVAANTCANMGSGALAIRVNGAWKCYN